MLPAEKLAGQTADAGLAGRSAVNYITASASVSTLAMTTRDRTVKLVTTSDNGIAVTLPPVAESAGMMCFVQFVTKATNDCTINDDADDADFDQVTVDTQNDAFVLISDGIHWFCMNGGATT